MNIKAVLLMGGLGKRFGSSVPKQFLNLSGKKVYLWTLETFLSFSEFSEIILVCHPDWVETVKADIADPRVQVVVGASTRQASSFNGLIACKKQTTHVMIHDAVRPLVSRKIIQENINALQKHAAIDTCIVSEDTLAQAASSQIVSFPDRSKYFRGQTPQSFAYPLIVEAHQNAIIKDATDDCQLVFKSGHSVHMISGSKRNIKITTELDLFIAEQLLRTETISIRKGSISLQQKTYAITGGTGGIGSALAELLKQEGAHPLIISKSSATFCANLADYKQTEFVFNDIYKKHGNLDGIINCVGHLNLKPFKELSKEEIDFQISVNLNSCIYSCKCVQLKKGGHVINVASSSFVRGRKCYALYSSCKAAIVNFTQGLADEHPELYINVIAPRRTATRMRKLNFPEEDVSTLLSAKDVANQIIQLLMQTKITGCIYKV